MATSIQLPRALLALVAVAIVAWSAVLWRNDRVGYDAAGKIFGDPTMSQSEWEHSLDQLRQADLLDPGTKWEVSRASALLLRNPPAAARLAESVIAREPDNLQAWMLVYEATRVRDPARAREARAQVERLNPLPFEQELPRQRRAVQLPQRQYAQRRNSTESPSTIAYSAWSSGRRSFHLTTGSPTEPGLT